MKKLGFVLTVCVIFMLMGCATIIPIGNIYTAAKLPVTATSNSGTSLKTGEAQCTSILGMVAFGDCSIDTAKKNGGITKVFHVDWDVKNILGIYGTYKVIVSGE